DCIFFPPALKEFAGKDEFVINIKNLPVMLFRMSSFAHKDIDHGDLKYDHYVSRCSHSVP
ncbi:hypothetical protein AABM19_10665, partial [Limosilactobacillus fermentum]|uniref:hypothetical protein n=1 Tax=Limosilactobacillus fermentum TaxID=1613 RepID=UPI003354735D